MAYHYQQQPLTNLLRPNFLTQTNYANQLQARPTWNQATQSLGQPQSLTDLILSNFNKRQPQAQTATNYANQLQARPTWNQTIQGLPQPQSLTDLMLSELNRRQFQPQASAEEQAAYQAALTPPPTLLPPPELSRARQAMIRGGGFLPSAQQEQAIAAGGFEKQSDLDAYNKAQNAARFQGIGKLLMGVSDAFAGRDIGKEYLGRETQTKALQDWQRQQNAFNEYLSGLDPNSSEYKTAVLAGPKGLQDILVASATAKSPILQQNVAWANADPTPTTPLTESDQAIIAERIDMVKGRPLVNLAESEQVAWVKSQIAAGEADITESRKAMNQENANITKYRQAQIMLNDPDFATGIIAKATLPMRQLYTEITEKDGTNVSNQMALQAIADWLTPRMRPVGSGASSDFEQKMFARSTVGLDKPKLANQIIVGSAIQSAHRDQEIFKLKEQYYTENKSTTGFTEWLTEDLDGDGNSDRLPSVYQSINTAAVGEDGNNVFATMVDNNLIQEGEVFIEVVDPNDRGTWKLRVFRKRDFYEN